MMGRRSLTDEVLAWSVDRPGWQRDALRRLATTGGLEPDDIDELATLSENEAAANDHRPRAGTRRRTSAEPEPLAAEHLPVAIAERPGVHVESIKDVRGVNALMPGAELEFGTGTLSVISGWNGAGKSGYARILERVARSRAPAQPILPNVYLSETIRPEATLQYRVDGDVRDYHWREDEPATDEDLARLAFFDARVAVEHVEKRVDVRYTPTGLDLLAGLADVCRQVESTLRRRQRALVERRRSWPLIAGTAVESALDALGTPEGLSAVRRLASLSDDEQTERETLRRQVAELQSSDPARRAGEANAHAGQLDVLARLLRHIGEMLGPEAIAHLVEVAADVEALELSAAAASAERFAEEPLPGVGSAEWRAMWEAAREYSERTAYPEHAFPHLDSSRCVLCQQNLDAVTAERLRRYEAFVASDLEDQRSGRSDELEGIVAALASIPLDHPGIDTTREIVRLHDATLAERVDNAFEAARALLAEALDPGEHLDDLPSTADRLAAVDPVRLASELDRFAGSEREQASRLASLSTEAAAIGDLAARLEELDARADLAVVRDEVLAEHDRRLDESTVAAAMRTCNTTAITRLSTDLSATGVDELREAFAGELETLGLRGVDVSLVSGGGTRGVSYVRVTLPAAKPGLVPRVLSEGECRVVALAAFLAEITVSGDGSAIVLDDPVSSLDHRFRRNVATRLVAESQRRQVIVFTHDNVFVNDIATNFHDHKLELRMRGESEPHPVTYRNVVRSGEGSGVVTEDLGLRNPKASTRLRIIERQIDEAATLYEAGDEQAYERMARAVLRPLREAWERAVEEILLHEVVVRHGTRVQTRRLRYLVGISDEEVAGVDRGMSVESRFLHDVPVGEETPAPPPTWLRREVQALRTWVRKVQERQRRVGS